MVVNIKKGGGAKISSKSTTGQVKIQNEKKLQDKKLFTGKIVK